MNAPNTSLLSTITRWNPLREFEDLQNRTRSLFLRSGMPGESQEESEWSPPVDIAEDEKQYTLTLDLPDVPKDQVKVYTQNGSLTIEGERRQEKEEKGKTFHRIERSYGKCVRTFQLPDEVDGEKIDASFKDGVLTVHLPKSEEKKPPRQDVMVS